MATGADYRNAVARPGQQLELPMPDVMPRQGQLTLPGMMPGGGGPPSTPVQAAVAAAPGPSSAQMSLPGMERQLSLPFGGGAGGAGGGGGGGTAAAGGSGLFNFASTESQSMLGRAMDAGGVRAAIAGAAIGGTASYATGGEFGAGALAGGSMAFAARGLHRTLAANSDALGQRAFNASQGEGFRSKMASHVLSAGPSMQRVQQRHAMMAGAGLFGVVGGGERNRNNHRRGFNAHRGNSF